MESKTLPAKPRKQRKRKMRACGTRDNKNSRRKEGEKTSRRLRKQKVPICPSLGLQDERSPQSFCRMILVVSGSAGREESRLCLTLQGQPPCGVCFPATLRLALEESRSDAMQLSHWLGLSLTQIFRKWMKKEKSKRGVGSAKALACHSWP